MIEAAMLLAALALDLALGEPPARLHPVVWMGHLVAWLERLAPKGSGFADEPSHGLSLAAALPQGDRRSPLQDCAQLEWRGEPPKPIPSPVGSKDPTLRRGTRVDLAQLIYGGAMPVVGVLVFALPAWALLDFLRQSSPVAYFVLGTLLLKSTFSVRALLRAAEKVRRSLVEGQIAEARANLRSLVSRDTASLSEPLVVAAAVESVAENTGDSFVAPVFYYLLLGVPGALAYRMVNTFDSMVGYHGRYEYLGKASARLDDLANLLPARVAGLLLVAASWLVVRAAAPAWRAMWRYHGATESPNAGWPMSAMAGALGVTLVKVGHYSLGDSSSPLTKDKIGEANRVALALVLLGTALVVAIEVVKHAYLA